MFSRVISGIITGLDACIVNVEVDVGFGIPTFEMSGILASEVKEARERVRVAIRNSGFEIKPQRISVNISPADIRKGGTGLDLPIAIGILSANGLLDDALLSKAFLVGELSLNGDVNPVKGILPSICSAKENGCEICIIPMKNICEGSVIEGVRVYGTQTLRDTVDLLNGKVPKMQPDSINSHIITDTSEYLDYTEIKGQQAAKRATLIAAAGMHNLMYIGSPGSGKTLMAKRIPTILPSLSFEESLEISKIYSVAGQLNPHQALLSKRPFRSPHHTITPTALIGGGRFSAPGEITLAAKGVLFLDELTEFHMSTIESLRQPLEDKKVTVVRLNAAYTYPADFMLVAAINPCKCGYYPDRNICHCSEHDIKRYLGRISQPFWDRFDICVQTNRIQFEELNQDRIEYSTTTDAMNSDNMKKMVEEAISFQRDRYEGTGIKLNSELTIADIRKYCVLGREETMLLENAYKKLNMTARGYHKVLKTARTIADISHSEKITCEHLSEAISYRSYENII